MASALSRYVKKLKCRNVLFFFKRYSSNIIVNPEIRVASEDVNNISTLFVPGRHGGDMYQIVKPVIDIDYITDNLKKLKLSCEAREINLDLDNLLEVAGEWLKMRNKYVAIVEEDQKYVAEIHRFNALSLKKELETMQEKRKKSVEILVSEKNKLHDIEDTFMPLIRKVPHLLHPNTPFKLSVIDVCQEPQILHAEAKSHVEIARNLSSLCFTNYPSTSFFMSGKLSKLEVALQSYFMDKLEEYGFFALNGVDFCKSFIIEAIGNNPYSSLDSIQVKEKEKRESAQKLHLVGNASFETFCAYFTNMNIDRSTLPFKYFSLGRRYNAANRASCQQNLFSVVQSTNVHVLILSESHSSESFEMLLNLIQDCYVELNIPYRIVNIAAKNLTVAESRRKQFQLWSPALKDYIPVAYVSQHDDFVSKRLQITYGFQHEKEGYCHIVEGTFVNVPVLIGCIIENFQSENDFNVPAVLEKYVLTN